MLCINPLLHTIPSSSPDSHELHVQEYLADKKPYMYRSTLLICSWYLLLEVDKDL